MFRDRSHAGRLLAARLTPYAGRKDAIVLGLSRGGMAVAHAVARELRLPLDVFLVRRLPVPDHRLMSMGAVASGGARVIDEVVVEDAGLSAEDVAAVEKRERAELQRQEASFRDDREPLKLRERTVIFVDDGIASGDTMLAAVACARRRDPRYVVAASPVGSAKACKRLSLEADEVVCLETPERYHGVGQWYENFAPISAEQVQELLAREAESS